jgi:hypothetical protein
MQEWAQIHGVSFVGMYIPTPLDEFRTDGANAQVSIVNESYILSSL